MIAACKPENCLQFSRPDRLHHVRGINSRKDCSLLIAARRAVGLRDRGGGIEDYLPGEHLGPKYACWHFALLPKSGVFATLKVQ